MVWVFGNWLPSDKDWRGSVGKEEKIWARFCVLVGHATGVLFRRLEVVLQYRFWAGKGLGVWMEGR